MLKQTSLTFALLVSAGLLATACSKKAETPDPATTAAPEAQAPAPVAQASAAASSSEEDEDATRKRLAIEFALMENKIKNDPKGQWAVSAKASTTYSSKPDDTRDDYHPFRATGEPDTQTYGDHGTAWATKEADAGLEWIELTYAKPVNASEIKIRQNNAPGAIISVEVYDEAGAAHTVWEGQDNTKYPQNTIVWMNIPFEKTAYKTQRLKITLATNAVSGWNEIDAVQLIGE